MSGTIKIEDFLGLVVATSLTSVGLLALWAVTSHRHWFFRTLIVLVVLSVLLLIPAYEPLLVLSIEVCTVVAGVQIWRFRARRRLARSELAADSHTPAAVSNRKPIRFSLSTLLLVTPVLAVICAMAVRTASGLPPQTPEAWTTIIVDGLVGGLAVLIGAWMFAARRNWLVWPVAIIIVFALGIAAPSLEWFLRSWGSWPPQPAVWNMSRSLFGVTLQPFARRDQWVWLGITASIPTLVFACMALAAIASNHRKPTADRHPPRQRPTYARVAAGLLLAIVLYIVNSFPIQITWQLLHPSPLPQIEPPNPNGMADVAAATAAFDTSPILNTSVEPTSTAALKLEITKHAAAYEQLHRGLGNTIRAEIWPKPGEPAQVTPASYADIMSARAAARALMREAQLAQREERFDEVAGLSLQTMQFGQELTRDSRLIGFLVGMAVEGIGDSTLYETIPHFDAAICSETMAELQHLERQREPLTEVLRRDRNWSENAFGWSGHFHALVQDRILTDAEQYAHIWDALWRKQAVTRMLIIELALRQFSLKHGKLPDSLDDLKPAFLDKVPLDPFDPAGRPLRYVRTDTGHFIYSVGVDHLDNGGKSSEQTSGLSGIGEDLRLDVYLKPDPSTTSTSDQTNSTNAEATTGDKATVTDARNQPDEPK